MRLFELRDTLENLKKITGNVNAVSEDVRQISRTVAIVEKIIRGVFYFGKGPRACHRGEYRGFEGRHYDRGVDPGEKSQTEKEGSS